MYEIALSVAACLRAGTRVDVAWVVEAAPGLGIQNRNAALAITPGGGRLGSILPGSLDDQLVDLSYRGTTGRIVDVTAGLGGGGDVRCLLVSAADLPAALWDRLRDRDPVCLVTRHDGDQVADVAMYGPERIAEAGADAAGLFGRGVSDSVMVPSEVRTVFWPVPRLVVIGAGAVADALHAAAGLLGWHTQTITDAGTATGVIAGLAGLDKVVVISHDVDLAGPALAAALAGDVGYIGALGSRRMQQTRADWLAYRGVTDLDRIHGPAGLDIGAKTPPEIAVSIVAEALAVRPKSTVG